jgi:hypothetical protein
MIKVEVLNAHDAAQLKADMEKKEIRPGDRAVYSDGYCVIYRRFDETFDFAIWSTSHLYKRGKMRGFIKDTTYWLSKVVDLLANEDVFYAVLDCKKGQQIVIIDEEECLAYPVVLGNSDIYVKTIIEADPEYVVYVKSDDFVIALNHNGDVQINDEITYIKRP